MTIRILRNLLVLALVIGILNSTRSQAQTPALPPQFEVASIRPNSIQDFEHCAGDGPSQRFAFERRFPDEIVCCGAKSVLVPYVDPGTILAQKIREETDRFIAAENRPPRVILLQNHGLIACGGTTGSVLAATLMAEKTARIFAGAAMMGGPTALTAQNVARIDSRPDEHYRQRMLKL